MFLLESRDLLSVHCFVTVLNKLKSYPSPTCALTCISLVFIPILIYHGIYLNTRCLSGSHISLHSRPSSRSLDPYQRDAFCATLREYTTISSKQRFSQIRIWFYNVWQVISTTYGLVSFRYTVEDPMSSSIYTAITQVLQVGRNGISFRHRKPLHVPCLRCMPQMNQSPTQSRVSQMIATMLGKHESYDSESSRALPNSKTSATDMCWLEATALLRIKFHVV